MGSVCLRSLAQRYICVRGWVSAHAASFCSIDCLFYCCARLYEHVVLSSSSSSFSFSRRAFLDLLTITLKQNVQVLNCTWLSPVVPRVHCLNVRQKKNIARDEEKEKEGHRSCMRKRIDFFVSCTVLYSDGRIDMWTDGQRSFILLCFDTSKWERKKETNERTNERKEERCDASELVTTRRRCD